MFYKLRSQAVHRGSCVSPRLPAFCMSSMISAVWSVLSPLLISICPACSINPSTKRFLGYSPVGAPAIPFTLSLASVVGRGLWPHLA